MRARAGAKADIVLEIVHGRLLAIADEMASALSRASMSPVIYEVLDFACGICSADGELVAQTNGITLFTGTFSRQVRHIMDRYGGRMAPGDTFVTNDPFHGGTHACDFAIVRPVFHEGRLIAFAIAVAHLLDVGGSVPGSLAPDATSVFQEGLRLPGVRLTRGDAFVEDTIHIVMENVRHPELVIGDMKAELAAVRIAERRLIETARKYGEDVLTTVFHQILDLSERAAQEAIARLPHGTYQAEDVIDGDGITDDPIPVRVSVEIGPGRFSVDFAGSSAARHAPINCSAGALHSAVKTVFKALVAPQEPSNDGWFRAVEISVPPGTVFSAEKPMPTGWYYEASAQASELVWKALAPSIPERFSAGSYMSLCATYITGKTQHGDFIHIEPQHGGWGATCERDGASGLIATTDGDTYNYSIEILEGKFPVRIHRYEFDVEADGGEGRFRGGFGLVREYEILSDGATLHGSFGRNRTPPWGVDGGRSGSTNYIEIRRGSTTTRIGRTAGYLLARGDRVRIVTGGGGGWGDPADRAREAVASDIRAGLIDPTRASAIYGSGPCRSIRHGIGPTFEALS